MQIDQIKTKLKERIAKGLNFGIEAVEEVLSPSAQAFNDYVLLKSKYNDLVYMSSVNTLPYDQIELALNRLRSSVIELIDRIEPEELKSAQLEPELRINALPTRRENFFRLLDIHFRNLEDISYVETYSDNVEKRYAGRDGIYEYYQAHRRRLRNLENPDQPEAIEAVKKHFREYFGFENGAFEVYFNNIKHLLKYAMESDVEQRFFLDTLRSLFSRFELATIHYYAFCGLDPEFEPLIRSSQLISADITDILISPAHAKRN